MTPEQEKEIRDYVIERDAILRKLDLIAYREFCAKHGVRCSPVDEINEIAMHKARMIATSFTDEEKSTSREWLESRDYKADIFS